MAGSSLISSIVIFCFPVRTAHVLTNVCVFTLHADSFSKLSSSKDFTFGDRLQNFPVLKDFTVEIVFEKRSVLNLDYIYIALDCSPPQGKDYGVSSLGERFFCSQSKCRNKILFK